MAIIHIYGARSIILLFRNHQDTASESREIEMSIYQPIFTHKKNQSIYGTTIPILYNMGENIVVVLHICGSRAVLLLFFNHQDTRSDYCEIERRIFQPIFTQRKQKRLYETTI